MSEISIESRRRQRGLKSPWVTFSKAIATLGVWGVSGYIMVSGPPNLHTAWILVGTLIGTFFIWTMD
jgi:hypothetical protein